VSLTARYLEANGIPTVIMGSAKDIVEHCGVPRFLYSDFPLGNSAVKPHDPDSQAETLELALQVLEHAPGPRTTVQSRQRWSDDLQWKLDFQNVDLIPKEEIDRRRAEFDKIKEIGQKVRDETQAKNNNPLA
jgi:D-proline reductase (dithiol) PrdB